MIVLVLKNFSKQTLQGQFLSALDSLLQYAEDLLVDIPKFWDFLAEVGIKFVFDQSLIFIQYSKVVAPTLAPSGPLPLSVVKDSAVQVKVSRDLIIFPKSIDCILIFSVNLHFHYLKINLLYLKAKLLEGDFGAKCSAGKFAAAILNEMGKQVLSLNQHQIKFEQEQIVGLRAKAQSRPPGANLA